MKLLLDLQAIQGAARNRGLGRYSLEFAAAMASRPGVTETIVLLNGGLPAQSILKSRELVEERIPTARIEVFDAPWPWAGDARDPKMHRQAETVRDQLIHELGPDAAVVCSPFSSPFESVVSVAGQSRPFTAVVVYDLLQQTDPDSRLADEDQAWFLHRMESVARADLLLCISDFTARAVKQHLGVSCPPISTIWGSAFGLPEARSTERRGVLVAGGDGRRKNEASTIRAYSRIPESLRRRHPLTVVGRQDRLDLDPETIARRNGLTSEECVVLRSEVSDEQLARLYAQARLLVMPSRGEGLGMPVLEAWRFGTPAITSNVTSLPELMGEGQWMFDPDDDVAQARLIEEILSDDEAWARAATHAQVRDRLFSWARTAEIAHAALEEGLAERSVPGKMSRPTLALATPWPPQSSGIARHAQVMAKALSEHYRVTIVNGDEAGSAQARADGHDVLSPAEFDRQGAPCDRLLVQLGNNPLFHSDEVRLLKRWPCVAVAHDIDLHHLVALDEVTFPGGMPALRYLEHGLAGWLTDQPPVGIDIFRSTISVLVHSNSAADYLTCEARSTMPESMVHRVPLVIISDTRRSRPDARQRLGIGDSEVLIATFGRVAPEKGVHTVVEAFVGLAQQVDHVRFVAVGPTGDTGYRERLEAMAHGLPAHLTGEVSDDVYSDWLAAADIAVQLRPVQRGETSAALLDALGAGCAVVVEDVASMGELASHRAIAVESPVKAEELQEVLRSLVDDPDRREGLQRKAVETTWERHSPEVAARSYRDAIEEAYQGWASPIERLPRAVAQARSLAINRPDRRGETVYIDVTSLVETTRRTGIERVVASLASGLGAKYPGRVMPIMERDGRFRHATEALGELSGASPWETPLTLPSDSVRFRSGDILLCAETKADVDGWSRLTSEARSLGAYYVQIVHDLLPVRMPDFFPPFVEPWFETWLSYVAGSADLAVCVSQATEADFRQWLAEHGLEERAPRVTWLRNACDLGNSRLVTTELRQRARGSRRVLVVGTIEPRKGVDAVLDAAEALWAEGDDVDFVFVGRQGWAGSSTLLRLRAHAESSSPLTWLSNATDLDLQWEYLNADLLVMASRGEGFGLPIVEAVAHGVPVLARDLPVFREILGPDGDYFTLDGELPAAILERLSSPLPPTFVQDRLVTWSDTAQDLIGALTLPRRDGRAGPEGETTRRCV